MSKPRNQTAEPVLPLTARMGGGAKVEARRVLESPTPAAIQGQCDALVSSYAHGVQKLDGEIAAAGKASPDALVGLALVVAREILSHQNPRDQAVLLERVDDALRAVGEDTPRLLRLGHADCEYVRVNRAGSSEDRLELCPDPSLESCEFILETPRHVIDGTLGAKLEAVHRKLIALVRDALSPGASLDEEGAC